MERRCDEYVDCENGLDEVDCNQTTTVTPEPQPTEIPEIAHENGEFYHIWAWSDLWEFTADRKSKYFFFFGMISIPKSMTSKIIILDIHVFFFVNWFVAAKNIFHWFFTFLHKIEIIFMQCFAYLHFIISSSENTIVESCDVDNEFECENHMCIELIRRCDRHIDCDDGSDELDCDCK